MRVIAPKVAVEVGAARRRGRQAAPVCEVSDHVEMVGAAGEELAQSIDGKGTTPSFMSSGRKADRRGASLPGRWRRIGGGMT